MRRLRAMVLLGAAAAVAVMVVLRRATASRRSAAMPGPVWPPLVLAAGAEAAPVAPAAPAWVAPVAGVCPPAHPVKVGRSGIFHLPDGVSYERTAPVRCYARTDDAAADGYRRAKR